MKDKLLTFLKENKQWWSSDQLLEFGSKKDVELWLKDLKKEGIVDSYQKKSGYAVFRYFRYSYKIITANQLII